MLTSKEKQGHGPQSVDRIRVTASYSGRYQLSDVLLPDKGIQSDRDDNTKCRQNAQISLTGHPENRTGKQIRAALFLPSKKGIFFRRPPGSLEGIKRGTMVALAGCAVIPVAWEVNRSGFGGNCACAYVRAQSDRGLTYVGTSAGSGSNFPPLLTVLSSPQPCGSMRPCLSDDHGHTVFCRKKHAAIGGFASVGSTCQKGSDLPRDWSAWPSPMLPSLPPVFRKRESKIQKV